MARLRSRGVASGSAAVRTGQANLPRRQPAAGRGNAGQNNGPDYATLRRIRMALKSIM